MGTRKFTPLILFILLFPALSWGQYRYKKFTYFGVTLGLKSELFRVADSGNELYNKHNFQNGIMGIFFEQELNRWLSINSGFYFTNYGTDFRFKRDDGFNIFNTMKTSIMPLRFSFNLPISYGVPEIRLVPSIGTNFVLNNTNTAFETRGSIAPDLSDTYSGTIYYNLKKFYFLAEGGLNFDILFAKGLIVSVGGRYYQGITDVAKVDLEYRIGREINRGTLTSRGSFYSFQFGVKYPIRKGKSTKKR
jgi:hypothetical protein